MGVNSGGPLRGNLAEMIQGNVGPPPQELSLVLVIAKEFLQHFKRNAHSRDGSLDERDHHLKKEISWRIEKLEYQAETFDFSYYCVFLKLKSVKGFTIEGVGGIAPRDMVSEIWHNASYRLALDVSIDTIGLNMVPQRHNLTGRGVVWAVVDSGICADHPGFGGRVIKKLDLTNHNNPDDFDGHGTHVAGIIGGFLKSQDLEAYSRLGLDAYGNKVGPLSGVAPEIQLVNLKVINKQGDRNNTDAVVKALEAIESEEVHVDGVNISLENDVKEGHWCSGDCPVCALVRKITEKGIVVCAAAGNQTSLRKITCPGRSAEAITVGACHRSSPIVYGIHFNSAGGPTPDGRAKPDLVAPGVDILSYSVRYATAGTLYTQKTGTSMATAFVSGLCALMIQQRRAVNMSVGCETLKKILSESAISLGRSMHLQGWGLISAAYALFKSQLTR